MREWRYSSTILDLGTSGQLHTPATLFRGTALANHWDRRLGGPQSRSGRYGEEKSLFPSGNRTMAIQPVACPYTD
jgi:hypothetical protein